MENVSILINISNHPSTLWGEEQRAAAADFGNIMDLEFPQIDPTASGSDVAQLADEYAKRMLALADTWHVTVHIMGEMTFTFRLVSTLLSKGIRCVASTTERIVELLPDGSKRSTFRFTRFRDYVMQ